MICEESTATKALKRNMAMYCMNVMRKRTIDEQLSDSSVIMKCSLDLIIIYNRTGLEVSYRIGSQIASVTGSDESVRMHNIIVQRTVKPLFISADLLMELVFFFVDLIDRFFR
jgi:hypothetical protein